MNKLVILGFLAASATAVPTSVVNNVQLNRDLDCFEQENTLFSCISVKTVSMLDRAARSSDIDIIDGVKFVRETPMERNGKDLKTEVDIMNELPRDASDRAIKLMGMMFDSVMSFVRSHSLKLSMPEEGSISRALDEARTKLKKIVLPLLLALKLKAMIVLPIIITLIGLIGIKGLGAGLLSLLLSGAVALKALLTPPPPPARVTYGVVKPEIHHEHWHRSQEELNQPYRGWAPEFGPEQYPYQDIP